MLREPRVGDRRLTWPDRIGYTLMILALILIAFAIDGSWR